MRSIMNSVRRLAVGILLVGTIGGVAQAQPLRRDLSAYFILASREARLKDLVLNSACNIGVNCAQPVPSSDCGNLIMEDPFLAPGSQAAADIASFTKPGGSICQLFRNGGGALNNVTINCPPVQPLNPLPIIANLDGDGNPSCGPGCVPDLGDLEAGCGFPSPFPACAPGSPVTANKNADCSGAADAVPANGRCDLPPGTYGDVVVKNEAKVTLVGGTYNVCSLSVGKSAEVVVGASAVVNIASPGSFNVNNGSSFGTKCGDIAVRLKGSGTVSFGRGVFVAAQVCAPGGLIRLGDGNRLIGQFVGDAVFSDSNNDGECCAGGLCACFDSFSPSTAAVGATITLTSMCDLTTVTKVKICDIDAVITSQSAGEIKATVPAGAAGQMCTVKVESAVGVFTAVGLLTVP